MRQAFCVLCRASALSLLPPPGCMLGNGVLFTPCTAVNRSQHCALPVPPGLGSYGGMERLHYLLERVWERPDEELSVHFLKARLYFCLLG